MEKKLSWNLDEFRELLQRTHDTDTITIVTSFLDSISNKIYIAAYHKRESKRVLDEILGREEYDSGIDLILEQSSGTERGRNFNIACKCAEANIVAYAQSLHSSIDILGNVIVYGLGLKKLLEMKRWSIHGVRKEALKLKNTKNITHNLETLLSSSIYEYIAAYTNSQKHVQHLKMPFTADFGEEGCRAGIKLAPFEYLNHENKMVPYQTKWADEFFEESKFVLEGIVTVGNDLSDYLRK